MEIIEREITKDPYRLSFFSKDMLFFDIETLGLFRDKCEIYLIGTMFLKGNTPTIRLYFAEKRADEEEILRAFYELTKDYPEIVTFNGDAFDIPFVSHRGTLYGLNFDFSTKSCLDLYKTIRPFKEHLMLKRLGQKALEEFLDLHRTDEYDGGRLIEVYYAFEKGRAGAGRADLGRAEKLKELLILHNYEDVEGMLHILPILSYRGLSRGEYRVESAKIKGLELVFTVTLDVALPKGFRVLRDYCHFVAEGDKIKGTINLFSGDLKYFHKDYKNYYYLPGEDIIVPKLMAESIPKSRRVPAKASTCSTLCSGLFFKLPDKKFLKPNPGLSEEKFYRESYNSKELYIPVQKKNSPDNPRLSEIVKSVLNYTFS